MEEIEKSLYERAKFVQKDIFEIAKSLRFIRSAMENDDSISSFYNRFLVEDMIERIAFFADNAANEVFRNLKIKEPEESTDTAEQAHSINH